MSLECRVGACLSRAPWLGAGQALALRNCGWLGAGQARALQNCGMVTLTRQLKGRL